MRLLIAEDDPYSLKILQLMLKSEQGYEVIGVADGEAAWRALETGLGFNLCIFDIMMPGLDGLELTRRIRRDPRFKGQRIILCSALNDRHTIDQAATLSVSHYIVKPYAKEHVLRQVRRVCEETAAAIYFEPHSQVVARLGVSLTELREILIGLYQDATQFMAAWTAARPPDLLRVNALRGAALNLGACALSQRLGRLESALHERHHVEADAARAALEEEIERLRIHLGIELPPPTPPVPAPAAESGAVPVVPVEPAPAN